MMAYEDSSASSSSSGLHSNTATAATPSTTESREAPSNVASSDAQPKAGRQLATMRLNDSKAGMEGLDTDKINQIIEKASRGSKFYNHKKQRQEKIDERIQHMLKLKNSFTPEQIARAEAQMDALAAQLEQSRDLSRFIVHVDMDAFYAAVEMRDRPELRDVPMAVGSTGMLSTSNYAARKFGVRAAMPGFIGRKLCPQLVIVPCDFDKYRAASQVVQEVLARYDPDFSMMSLDEGYLDITERVAAVLAAEDAEDCEDRSEDEVAQELVRQLRAEICQRTQLTASAGIACNGMLAKICSDQNKPDGQFFLRRERRVVLDFLRQLPVRKVCGIGNVLSQQLAALNITCCGQLLERRGLLRLLFSETAQHSLLRAGLGVRQPPAAREDDGHQKSVSTETTFAATADAGRLTELHGELCTQLADDLRRKGLRGRTITLKVKTSSFVVRSRAVTLAEPTSAAAALLAATRPALARELDGGEPLRLLGVRASALVAAEGTAGRRQATLTEMAGQGASAAARHVCPVCGRTARTLAELSAHVDRCLDGEGSQDDGDADVLCDGAVGDRPSDGGAVICEGDGDGDGDGDGGGRAVDSAAGAVWDQAEDGIPPGRPLPCGGVVRGLAAVSGGAGGSLAAVSGGGDMNSAAAARDGGAPSAGERLPPGPGSAGTQPETVPGADRTAEGADSRPAVALCPVCARPLPDQLLQVNRHLDECLNQQLLSQLTDGAPVGGLKRPSAPHAAAPPSKHKRIDSFFRAKK